MASSEKEDFESEWTFVDTDGSVDIKPRKSSVLYSKSPSTSEEPAGNLPPGVSSKEDSEGEAEFEVLSGFHCSPLPETEDSHSGDLYNENEECEVGGADEGSEVEDDELLSSQDGSCRCSSDDGIMIISTHFCVDNDAAATDSPDNTNATDTAVTPEPQNQDEESLCFPSISPDALDGWKELPQLSESGSYSFSDLNSSDEDAGIELITDEDGSQDFVDLSHEADKEMVESLCSVFSFDSDLFNPSDADEDIDSDQDPSDVEEVSDLKPEEEEEQFEEYEGSTIDDEGSHDYSNSLMVDLPTLFVLLGLTTALGFSFGYGLSVYYSNRALTMSGGIKRPGPSTASLPLRSDPMESLDDLARDVLDQTAMWKLEDRLDTQKEPSESETELGDLFDTKALHERLQQKHFRLMNSHESVKQRLHMSKVMSWYWRLKYEEERSKKEGGEWSQTLQDQLQHMEALYLQEKHIADLWRRRNENQKLKQAVAGSIKFDKYWKDFLNRWRKGEEKRPPSDTTNTSQSAAKHDTREFLIKPEPEVNEKPEAEENERSDLTSDKTKKLIVIQKETQLMRDYGWMDFRARWTRDAQAQGNRVYGPKRPSEDCASSVEEEKDSQTKSMLRKPLDVRDRDGTIEGTDVEPGHAKVHGKRPYFKQRETKKNKREVSDKRCAGFKEGFQFENPLFPRNLISSVRENLNHEHLSKRHQIHPVEDKKNKLVAIEVPKGTFLQVIAYPDGTGKAKWFYEDGSVKQEAIVERNRNVLPTGKSCWSLRENKPIKSYVDLAKRKCKNLKEGVVAERREVKLRKTFKKVNVVEVNRTEELCLYKEKQELRNLSRVREEEIRKQRIQRREYRKKEREAARRLRKVEKVLLELQKERRGVEKSKRGLRRSWDSLKREKRKLSSEKESYKKGRKNLKKFIAKVKEEKQSLKKVKGNLEKEFKEKLATQVEKFKEKKKDLYLKKKREVERIRGEISKERKALEEQQKELKALKQAAKKEYKKWLKELRKIKQKEKERKQKEEAKVKERGRENVEVEKQRRRLYDALVQEQFKYDQEKRRNKGNSIGSVKGNYKWKKKKGEMQSDGGQPRQKEKNGKRTEWEEKFRKQLDTVNDWMLHVHKKGLEQEQLYGREEKYEGETKKNKGEAVQRRPHNNAGKEEGKQRKPEPEVTKTILRKRNWKNGAGMMKCRRETREERVKKSKENNKVAVRKSALIKISENKAVADFTNFTFNVDLVEALIKGFDGTKRKDEKTREAYEGRDAEAFIEITEEPANVDSDRATYVEQTKPITPDGNEWLHKYWYQDETSEKSQRKEPSPSGRIPNPSKDSRVNGRFPNPSEDSRMMIVEWYHEWLDGAKKKRNVLPEGPNNEERQERANKQTSKPYDNNRVKKKVCTSRDPEQANENPLPIPPPDWIFDRAKGRADQRLGPWYDRRAEDRTFQRRTDQHNTHFPRGQKCRPAPEFHDPTWLFDRASDRADQRSNNEPWYSRRAEGREEQRHDNSDTWLLERGRYRRDLRELTTWYEDQNWMPRGPSMDEHR